MIDFPERTKFNTKPTIIRQGHLAENIVIIDGHPGCGKTLFSPIIAAMDRVELLNFSFIIEWVCRLSHFQKIDKDAAVTMIRLFTDLQLYNTMQSREINFRYSDLSSVFNSSNSWRYIKRIFQDGDMAIPEKIKNENPILSITTHDLLSMSGPVFNALNNRLVFIEVVRHPLYMVIQQTLNMERLLNSLRHMSVYIKYEQSQLPYFAYQLEELFAKSNSVEKAIYTIQHSLALTETFKNDYDELINGKILTIPFEKFVLDPWPYMTQAEEMIKSKITKKTKKIIKKQNVPRKRISDGIPLAIYKRCGWEPPVKGLTEREELDKRRQFAVEQGASKHALDVLDQISDDYEKNYGIWF